MFPALFLQIASTDADTLRLPFVTVSLNLNFFAAFDLHKLYIFKQKLSVKF